MCRRLIIISFTWGDVDCNSLADKFGTPLYVYDESVINSRCNEIEQDFLQKWDNTFAYYASKAFSIKYMTRIIKNHGMGLDVVSEGELLTALHAGFPAEKIELHGNAKSFYDINSAVKSGVGRFIIDNIQELELLAKVSHDNNFVANVLFRVTPDVKTDTHAHISTGVKGSKFGFPIEGDMLNEAVKFALNDDYINSQGIHFHVGSQLFEPVSHLEALKKIIKLMLKLKRNLNFITRELNFGGGFGARINPKIEHVALKNFTDPLMQMLESECKANDLLRPRAAIESGRWIVSEAGITLYTVENVKRLPGILYIAVNGGMSDNPRYALYGAEYEAVNVNNPDGEIYNPEGRVSIVGKCCESGDILIDDAKISYTKPGDIIAIYNTGAYNFSMASNYNKLLRPAVIFANNGEANLKVERQTYEDLLKGELL